ncbi:isocitrate lyase/PEP mutase family protein [Veronia pacifica]|uniref:Carboxyvinyl-carboxyphosphonate phosphorylmutase n=1 Tax=Veronia pacifica TaxID=1080227 RepID=A0A1C3EDX0_9GAMM|nr:isocitrate lyase/phosphoenolpyruvate mutase family protein [Veronia pacifica]ODA31404.1 carboxyvinyl-carboxyphosphonate phosphorylmutase [Veronia pacifica]
MHTFEQLHQQSTPLLIGNVWDATSAKMAEEAGYQALGTSSAAIASMLGYQDGENIPFAELLFVVKRLVASSLLPLSVDIEAGYGVEPNVIADNIQQLAECGVVGINMEDSIPTAERKLRKAEDFAHLLKEVRALLKERKIEIFTNVRTDTFLLGVKEACSETIRRAEVYQAAGADGLFVPGISDLEDIKRVVNSTTLPINVMTVPDLPNFENLTKAGVKRISSGNFAHEKIYQYLGVQLREMKSKGTGSVLVDTL